VNTLGWLFKHARIFTVADLVHTFECVIGRLINNDDPDFLKVQRLPLGHLSLDGLIDGLGTELNWEAEESRRNCRNRD
jgi:hypothetical protein